MSADQPNFPGPVPFLRSIDGLLLPLYDLPPDADAAGVAQHLRKLEAAQDDAWISSATIREKWITHVLNRLDRGHCEYGDASFERPVLELLAEIKEEAADIGGWAAITNAVLGHHRDLDAEAGEALTQLLKDAAAAGAEAWTKINGACLLLAAIEEQGR